MRKNGYDMRGIRGGKGMILVIIKAILSDAHADSFESA